MSGSIAGFESFILISSNRPGVQVFPDFHARVILFQCGLRKYLRTVLRKASWICRFAARPSHNYLSEASFNLMS